MDACKDARESITMAFRPGMVDLPADQLRASNNTITFADIGAANVVDMLDWSVPDLPAPTRGAHTAPLTQTNLRSREYGAFNFGRAGSIFGDESRQGSHDSAMYLESQDFGGIDLGLGLDDFENRSEVSSLEQGRDAQRERSRSVMHMFSPNKAASPGLDIDMPSFADGPIDLGLGLDDDMMDIDAPVPDLLPAPDIVDAERARRETSALSTPPPQSPPLPTMDVSPRTAKRIADMQNQTKQKRVRIVRADQELELADEEFVAPNEEDSDILAVERFIPADPESVLLDDFMENPSKHFMPSVKVDAETFFFAGPAGLAPELSKLFLFNPSVLRRNRGVDEVEEQAVAKRPRLQSEEEVEAARRVSHAVRAPSEGPDLDFSFDVGLDQLEPDVMLSPVRAERTPSMPPIRPLPVHDGEYKLAAFSGQGDDSQSQSVSSTPSKSQSGASKTTVLAVDLLRHELGEPDAHKSVQFDELARGANKRAASAFFFELLVLGTKDAVKLEQHKAFGNISVQAKDKLWAM
jgi:cohesin complex subunit SCC1